VKLGEGGMVTVYLADDIKHEPKVALKVLNPELAAVERFLAEIKTTANLQHPRILMADYHCMPIIQNEPAGGR
jgi:serine/threonine protein kinase|tara:strand:+ start:154 stop:372 length:219 start_codon:yes stop_codon:yes gene_type:complete